MLSFYVNAQIIGPCDENDAFVAKDLDHTIKTKKAIKGKGGIYEPGRKEGKEKKHTAKQGSSLGKQSISFVSSGIWQPGVVESSSIEVKETTRVITDAAEGTSSSFGAFEVHTKGFGSKMMAKMGFVGGGLGKDGQGMSEPIEVNMRPKSLGLGVDFTEPSSKDITKGTNISKPIGSAKHYKNPKPSPSNSRKKETRASPKIGAFESHTKGFGSKMMMRMGFVEGTGLGKDSQGIVTPIAAVWRPRAHGLGAKA